MSNTQLAAPSAPTPEKLREVFAYEPETGHLRWKKLVGGKSSIGKPVGSLTKAGYLQCQAFGKKMTVHRAAWAIAYGEFPELVDHINGDRTDNRLNNLRAATAQENSRNSATPSTNTSGIKGVSWCQSRGRWLAQIALGGGKTKNLGRFKSKDEAAKAVQIHRQKIHGEFASNR